MTLAIDAGLHGRLLDLARAGGATLFMALQAGVAALLHRLGAGEDVPLGAPVAGRGEAALDGLVGFFVNTLVLRCDLSGRPGFARLLARVRDGDLEAFAHADTPFELVVDALAPARALDRNPLFQVMVVLQNHAPAALELSGVAAEPLPLGPGAAKFDLAFEFAERLDGEGGPAGLDGRIDYSADLFDAATARALADRLVRLLAAAAADPGRPVARLELLAPAERRWLVEGVNATAAPLPDGTVVELLQAQAERTPEATALVLGDGRLSYAELHARADRLARLLIARGVGPEVVVAICLERSFLLVEAVLAVLKAGGAYLPLDPDHPPERLASTLADAAPALVLTTRALAQRLPAGTARLTLDHPAVAAELAGLPAGPLGDAERLRRLRPGHPAYLVYTSGSTGTPKGVLVAHAGLPNLARSITKHLRIDRSSRVAQFAAFSFDGAVAELVFALAAGAALILPAAEEERAGAPLAAFLRRQAVSHAILPPAVLPSLSPRELQELATLVVVGEVLPGRTGRGLVRRAAAVQRLRTRPRSRCARR